MENSIVTKRSQVEEMDSKWEECTGDLEYILSKIAF